MYFFTRHSHYFQFFSPIQPVRCEFEFGHQGRPTGEANVDFATHQEALEAMKKHRTNMRRLKFEILLLRAFGSVICN